ncbi:MAG: iron-only hydrogenase system regulator [Clostridia bacterium]|nr:iron-only hydrogenase system regulator [Clostridia bacterium]
MSEKRLAVVSVLVEDRSVSGEVNKTLSDFGEYAVGRMGIPYRDKSVNVICFVMDAPVEEINSLSGKLGMIPGVRAKVIMSK